MKTLILSLSFLFAFVLITAQDTLFLKSGAVIPSIIIEKGDIEIKYKKFSQPEPAGIYSVFVSDVAKIHFRDGKITDYSVLQSTKSSESDDFLPRMRFNLGVSVHYFDRNTSDELRTFWQALNNNNQLDIGGSKKYVAVNLSMGSSMGTTKRNWMGVNLQLIFTPSDALYASNTYNGQNEIKLNAFYYNIQMYYGHTLNHRKSLILLIEPGIDMVFMGGYIYRYDKKYKESGTAGISFQIAGGIDWNISKRFQLNLRAGEQFVKVKEEYVDKSAKYGYSSFVINPVASPNFPVNRDVVTMGLNGPFASIGLSYSLYMKIPTGRRK